MRGADFVLALIRATKRLYGGEHPFVFHRSLFVDMNGPADAEGRISRAGAG